MYNLNIPSLVHPLVSSLAYPGPCLVPLMFLSLPGLQRSPLLMDVDVSLRG